MGNSLNKLIKNKDAIIKLAARYGIEELKYSPAIFPSEVETVNLLASKRQPAELRKCTIAEFQHALKKSFEIDANVFTPEGIMEGMDREAHYPTTYDSMKAKYEPIIQTAFLLQEITQEKSAVSVIETPSPDVSALVAQYHERKRLRTSEPATDELSIHATDKELTAQNPEGSLAARSPQKIFQPQAVAVANKIVELLLSITEEPERMQCLVVTMSRIDCPLVKLQQFIDIAKQSHASPVMKNQTLPL